MFGKIIKATGFDSFNTGLLNGISGGTHEINLDSFDADGELDVVDESLFVFNPEHKTPLEHVIGFDESILEYKCLEGVFRATSFCFISQKNDAYNPAILLDLKFISNLKPDGELLNIWLDAKVNYVYEQHYHNLRADLIGSLKLRNSLIFIDGALFSGRNTDLNYKMIKRYESNRYVFFVKNSLSSQVIQFLNKTNYNNDLHWAYKSLRAFERSPIFIYRSHSRAKLFCYIKVAENYSPIRVETPFENSDFFYSSDLWTTIFRNLLAQMPSNNIQPRAIAIAEMYAREALKTSNIYRHLQKSGFIATMNEARF